MTISEKKTKKNAGEIPDEKINGYSLYFIFICYSSLKQTILKLASQSIPLTFLVLCFEWHLYLIVRDYHYSFLCVFLCF